MEFHDYNALPRERSPTVTYGIRRVMGPTAAMVKRKIYASVGNRIPFF
jgi:hypothetical protein